MVDDHWSCLKCYWNGDTQVELFNPPPSGWIAVAHVTHVCVTPVWPGASVTVLQCYSVTVLQCYTCMAECQVRRVWLRRPLSPCPRFVCSPSRSSLSPRCTHVCTSIFYTASYSNILVDSTPVYSKEYIRVHIYCFVLNCIVWFVSKILACSPKQCTRKYK